MRALVRDPALAVLARPPWWAGAGVGALARVAAGGTVAAGTVVRAVVKVLENNVVVGRVKLKLCTYT